MSPRCIRHVLAALCASACLPTLSAADLGDVTLAPSTQVGGHDLQLNGAGVSTRMLFKVYAMGLYLPGRQRIAADVLAAEGPRRMTIVPLRDISGEQFSDAVMQDLLPERFSRPDVLAQLVRLAKTIAEQPRGLRKGDVLTLDWVPDTGVVVALNRRPLTAPVRDIAVYQALLALWLGDNPADPQLKSRLLGHAQHIEPAPANDVRL